jgi:hypothetical protein
LSELIDTIIEYLMHERQARDAWRVSLELVQLAKRGCAFPVATQDQWQAAIAMAVKAGRLELVGTKVRYLPPQPAQVTTQMELF